MSVTLVLIAALFVVLWSFYCCFVCVRRMSLAWVDSLGATSVGAAPSSEGGLPPESDPDRDVGRCGADEQVPASELDDQTGGDNRWSVATARLVHVEATDEQQLIVDCFVFDALADDQDTDPPPLTAATFTLRRPKAAYLDAAEEWLHDWLRSDSLVDSENHRRADSICVDLRCNDVAIGCDVEVLT